MSAQPRVGRDGVPRCSEEQCDEYDGKRCRLMGCRPDTICEPAVIEITDELVRVKTELLELRAAGERVLEESTHCQNGVDRWYETPEATQRALYKILGFLP